MARPRIRENSIVLKCSTCKQEKHCSEFYTRKGITRGYQYNCIQCELPKKREYEERNRSWRSKTKRDYNLNVNYGITLDEYSVLYTEQQGKCAICAEPQERLDVDHCHETGNVRGLLCGGCNRGLGQFNDSPDKLEKALRYLQCVQHS